MLSKAYTKSKERHCITDITFYCAIFIIAFLVVFILVWCSIVVNAEENANKNESLDYMFEGDLKIPVEMILDNYNFSSVPGGESILKDYMNKISKRNKTGLQNETILNRRAARRDTTTLWPNAVVLYKISPRISSSVAHNIRCAIENFEDNTCLRFHPSNGTGDYIEFINTGNGCSSNFVGRKRGRQVINLQSPGCNSIGTIVHEIGHAIGYWHEQSRPDRDQYVTINWDNIISAKTDQFMKRSSASVDSRGSRYDYRSIMHYSQTAFHKSGCQGSNCYTISVSNPGEYITQGRPTLGNRNQNAMSREDIRQTNLLYSCARYATSGFLSVKVRQGISLRDTDGVWNNPDPYVTITAIDSSGSNVGKQTSYKQGTRDPVWNELLLFGTRNWQFFRMSAWDDDPGSDDQLIKSKNYAVRGGNHYSLKHCETTECNSYILYDYSLDTRTISNARLRVYVRYASHLEDTDPIWNSPDPYVRITAVQSNTKAQTKNTREISGTTSPTWNQWVDYGCRKWHSMFIQIFDDDDNSDDEMSNKELVNVHSGYHYYRRHSAHGNGILYYDYQLTVDGNDCYPNPCLNRGTCLDGCTSYVCSCRYGYSGTRCQHIAGDLSVTARYARDLPDEDGLWNDSDPYMEVIAVDANGNTVRKTSREIGGNRNPTWNQKLSFGYRAWKSFKVRIYDSDNNADDPLSNQQSFTLYRLGSHSGVRHNCNSGYAIFDYSYV